MSELDLVQLEANHSLYYIVGHCDYRARVALFSTCRYLHSLEVEVKDLLSDELKRLFGALIYRRKRELRRDTTGKTSKERYRLLRDYTDKASIATRQKLLDRVGVTLNQRGVLFYMVDVDYDDNYKVKLPLVEGPIVYAGYGYKGAITSSRYCPTLLVIFDIRDTTKWCDVYLDKSNTIPNVTVLLIKTNPSRAGFWDREPGQPIFPSRVSVEEIYPKILGWYSQQIGA